MTPAGAQLTAGASSSAAALLSALPATVDAAVVRDGPRFVVAAAPDALRVATGRDALAALDELPPGWWAGFLTYELGGAVEQVSPRLHPNGRDDEPALPDLVLARFPARLVLDPASGRCELHGDGEARSLLARAAEAARDGARTPASPALARWHTSLDRVAFEQRVTTILEHIGAGDCYQVNLTRRLTCDEAVDPVALFAALDRYNPSPHGALLRIGDARGVPATAVVSASPERFLSWRGRDVETRPIKGTSTDATTLAASAKDRAENVMIVDLARNDLGRVCEPGSVVVPALCDLESHPGLHHLVSTVRGRRRAGGGVGALVRATFPPASVTGAPKPRVMQIIEDLETAPRGVYCGAVGWIDTERDAGDLNVAIRTFTVTDGCTHLGVGAGIVADSEPAAEWAETELKAARLLAAAGADLADVRGVALAGAHR
ncbi:MAG TPA: anthranilate synthase component I family protein [Acidimicrobiia bacterium]|nr:anthranilate synthase component I family protein [Acidimicrobiia bacterium]